MMAFVGLRVMSGWPSQLASVPGDCPAEKLLDPTTLRDYFVSVKTTLERT